MCRQVLTSLMFAALMSLSIPSTAQPPAPAEDAPAKVLLKCNAQSGDQWQVAIVMELEGQVVLRNGDKVTPLAVKGKTEHKLDERVIRVLESQPTCVARFYQQARAEFQTHTNQQTRTLRPERRFQAARQTVDGTQVFCPNGPLTREELELCGGHTDVLAMHGILPGKEVSLGDAWDVNILAAQALTAMDAVRDNKMKAKLEKVTNEMATIAVSGKVDGIQQGSQATTEVKGLLEFSLKDRRLVSADWRQRDEHGQGPVHKASQFESAANVTWTYTTGPSAELLDAVIAQIPTEPTPAHLMLMFRESKDRCTFTYDRNWHIVANTNEYAVMRYLERGELLGQVNLRPWKQTRPGDHIDPKELKPLATENPEFALDQILEEGTLNASPGFWIYRIAAVGKAGDLSLMQTSYAVAGPRGEQVIAIFSCEVGQAAKFAGKDLTIVKTIEFPTIIQSGIKPQ